jgi:DNA-binding transcriptional LysR family regulator
MELRHLRYFVAVVEERGFTRAAERLQIAQSPLSQQILKLERELGVQLLIRSSRTLELTPAGTAFYERACVLVEGAEEAADIARRVSRGELGRLAVGFTGSATYELFPSIVRAYQERHPGVTLDPHPEMFTAAQADALLDGTIDVGVLRPPVLSHGLVVEVLRHEPMVALLPSNHPITVQRSIGLGALRDENFIAFPPAPISNLWDITVTACEQAGFTPKIRHVVSNTAAMATLVAAGLGVAVVPTSLRYVRIAEVTFRHLDPPVVTIPLAVAYRHGNRSVHVQRFVEIARAVVHSRGHGASPPLGRVRDLV